MEGRPSPRRRRGRVTAARPRAWGPEAGWGQEEPNRLFHAVRWTRISAINTASPTTAPEVSAAANEWSEASMAARAAAEPTGAAVTTPTMPAIVRRPRQQPPPSPCAVMNPTDRNAEPVRGRNAHQVRGELGRVVEVVAAEQSDAARVCVDLDPGPQHSLERHEPDEGQRREQNEAEG
jgi:hypothetical protein